MPKRGKKNVKFNLAKTEETPPSSPSENLHSLSAGSHSSNIQHVTSTSQGVSKTDNISPVPQVVAPALSVNPNSSTTTLIVSVPLVNADPSLLNQGVYQPLVRNDPSVDRVINPPRSPPRVPEIDRQSPLVEQLVSGSPTMSALNAMHVQTTAVGRLNEQSISQGISPSQNAPMHHQIGGVPINQSVVHSSTGGSTLNTLSSEMTGSVLKTGYEKQVKADEPTKRSSFQNGVHAPHMLGNQLNPNSNMAQKMSDHLNHELETHRVFTESVGSSMAMSTDETNPQGPVLVGPPLLRSTGATRPAAAPSSGIGNLLGGNVGAAGSNGGNGLGAAVPQSLDQLLERQWEQGSQFLMEQAQHFDIASLLSCLHQLRTENARLEEHVNTLVARRDHLLAVNARLAIPLTQPIPTGNAGGGVLRAAVNPSENGGQQDYRQVRTSNQYVNVGGVPHGPVRGQGSVEGARANRGYQPYPVPSQNHQSNIRRDPDNRDTHHSQKPN